MLDHDIIAALRDIQDPELGIGIVDLGLVYHAERTGDGIRVTMTMTTPSCPMSGMLIEQARAALRQRFPDTPTRVELVWDPPWSPERISDSARQQLGWRRSGSTAKPAFTWRTLFSRNRTRH